jgi:WD40 repeat protein
MTDLPVILLAFANEHSSGRYLARLSQEQELLWARVNNAETLCKPELVTNATFDKIDGVFQRYKERVAIFHYGGHANEECLLLTSSSRTARETDLRGLLGFWGRKGGLRLVFLNGCSTAPQVDDLLQAGVSGVIATARPVNDDTACGLADRFYGKLAAGFSIRDAFDQAQEGVNPSGRMPPRELILEGTDFAPEDITNERGFPWALRSRAESHAEKTSLPELAGRPLFGLPKIPKHEPLPPSPYRHLKPFTHKEATVFFGRDHEIRALYDLVTSPSSRSVILYSGPTGVGKSSVLDAGLVPRLAASHEVLYFHRDPVLGLLGTLARKLDPVASDEAQNSPVDLARLWGDRERPDRPLVAIIDQVEEVFTRPLAFVPPADAPAAIGKPRIYPDAELAELLYGLRAAFANPDREARPRGKLILGFRKEWLQEVERAHRAVELGYERMLLAPLDHPRIIEAIEGPIRDPDLKRHYGLTIEAALAERIARELEHDAGAALAPTLQVLLTNLWRSESGKGMGASFTHALYEHLKRHGVLLKDVLDQGLEALAAWRPELVRSGLAIDLLEHHTTSMDTAETRTRGDLLARYPHRADALEESLRVLENSYLLVPAETRLEVETDTLLTDQTRSELSTTRLGHDTLAPLVRDKFRKSDAPGQRARRLLENRSPDWRNGRIGAVLDRADLDTVEAGVSGMRAWDAEENHKAETRLVEASRSEQARRTLTRHILRAVAAAAAVVICVSGAIAWWQWGTAEHRFKIATSRELAALSTVERSRRQDLSLLLAVEALRIENTAEARDSLYNALQERPRLRCYLHIHEAHVGSVAFNPTGDLLAVAIDRGVVLWDVAAQKRVAEEPLFVREGLVGSISFSPDGKTLAAGLDRGVVFWDVASRQRLADDLVPVTEGRVWSIAFSPDGRMLAAGLDLGDDLGGGVVLWDVASRKRLTDDPLPVTEGSVTSVAFSPSSKELAAGFHGSILSGGGGVIFWDVISRKRLAGESLFVREGLVGSISFSPDGKTLAAGLHLGVGLNSGGGVVLWNTASRTRLGDNPLPVDEGSVESVSFSKNGEYLAAAFDRGVVLWAVATRKRLPDDVYPMPEGFVRGANFSPDGKTLAVGCIRGVVLWDTAPRVRLAGDPLQVREGFVESVAFSPDGKSLAVASAVFDRKGTVDSGAILCEVESQKLVRRKLLPSGECSLLSVAFSPDGTSLAAGFGLFDHGDSVGGGVALWDVAEWKQRGVLQLPSQDGPVRSVAFSRDSKILAGGCNRGVVLWDVASRQQLTSDSFPVINGRVGSVAFSSDGSTLAAGFDRGALLFDLSSRKSFVANPLSATEGRVDSVAFSRDGRLLAGGCDRGVVLWNVAARKPASSKVLQVEEGRVQSVAFSLDGKLLAAGLERGFVVLWDVATRRRLMQDPLVVGEAQVKSVQFHPDGKSLATGLAGPRGGGVVLWDIDLNSWEQLAGQIANRNFTWKEFHEYFPEKLMYRRTFPHLPRPPDFTQDDEELPTDASR